ncbi:MAG: hypothetical protein ACYC4L_22520 [Chloroflexota bacterium]
MWVESAEGQGSTFHIVLPLADSPTPAPTPAENALASKGAS